MAPEDDDELREAMRRHEASSRLVRVRAVRSAQALRRLNDLLKLRTKALQGIETADDALTELERAGKHD